MRVSYTHFHQECPVGDHSFKRLVEPDCCPIHIRMHQEESLLGTGRYTDIDEIVNEFRAVSY